MGMIRHLYYKCSDIIPHSHSQFLDGVTRILTLLFRRLQNKFLCQAQSTNLMTLSLFSFFSRYKDLNGKMLPYLRTWMEANIGADLSYETPCKRFNELNIPLPIQCPKFTKYLKSSNISFTNCPKYRLNRSHGQNLHDIWNLWTGKIGRIPDLVVWPRSAIFHNIIPKKVFSQIRVQRRKG
jgi:hypothetical protein